MQDWQERLDQALKARKVRKSYALAVEIGVDESAISRWRRGRTISLDNAVKLCDALDVSLDWLLTGRGHIDGHRDQDANLDRLGRHLLVELPGDRAAEAVDALLSLVKILKPVRDRG